MNLVHRSLIAGLALGALSTAPVAAEAPVQVVGAEIAAAEGRTRIALTLRQAATPRTLTLAGPDRFVVDVPAGVLPPRFAPEPAGLVRAIRHARQPDGSMRVVFDLTAAPRAPVSRMEPAAGGGVRIVYDLGGAPAARHFSAKPDVLRPAQVVFSPQPAPRPQAPALLPMARMGERVIVIDAGHGGKDPGASGAAGTREKEVVLAAALALREDLQSRGYRVVLTRERDVFLPLEDRVAIARRERADLFISLHADAHADHRASGASVYTLSERGGARAKAMMDGQNWEVDLGDAPADARVQTILVDLAQRETTGKSADFAQTLIGSLGREAPLLRNTHRSAGFFVLLAPDVPAVLLELGFLTHAGDETRLANPAVRRRMMGAVADSIDVYFARPRAYAGR